jgi:hypothetical protein
MVRLAAKTMATRSVGVFRRRTSTTASSRSSTHGRLSLLRGAVADFDAETAGVLLAVE